jgi:hypothetical protein
MLARIFFATLCIVAIAACRQTLDAPDASAAIFDAGAPPPPLRLTVRYALLADGGADASTGAHADAGDDGGTDGGSDRGSDAGFESIPFHEQARPMIAPTQELEIETSELLENYRIRLFDEAERAMVSNDEAEQRGNTILYRIHLPTPLRTGHRYALILDAQSGSVVTDASGRIHPDQRLEFQVAGEKQKDAPPSRKKRRR